MIDDFAGKVVVVTGAASGIGRETALAFARRCARLVICDIDGEGLEEVGHEVEWLGCEVSWHNVDVADASQVERLCDDVYRGMGRVDVLVNNAGVAIGGKFEDMTLTSGTGSWA